MATDTYLEMVSDMIRETGLSAGAVPSTLAGLTGDAAKVAYWIRVADLRIQRERIDWQFLWVLSDPTPLVQGAATVPVPVVNEVGGVDPPPEDDTILINKPIRDSFVIINASGEVYKPHYMEWREFSTLYLYDTQPESDYPAYWTIDPANRTLYLSNPVESAGLTYRVQFYRAPVRLRNDTDTTLIPDDFNRLVIVLGKIMYAEHEDAPEVSAGSHEEYDHMMNQLLSVWGPDNEWQRMDQDIPMEVDARSGKF